ncbi:MAG: metalloregulator ArsR/SmtB family transcription factor [Patescibacteria group bacterium]|nr:metalloregulator ArsR/SmtB family transcription factor [Patescibacteria group bacterium]
MLNQKELNKIKLKIAKEKNSISTIFYALSDKRRLQILKLLYKYKDLCVGDIAYILGISIPAVSQHMKILKFVGLINFKKQGKMVCYKINLNNKPIKQILNFIKGR